MVTKIEMYTRTASGKGFLQHFRLLVDSPGHLRGVCSGASVEWLSSHYLNGSDHQFWAKYSHPLTSHRDLVRAQDTAQSSAGLKICDGEYASSPSDPLLWRSSHESGLKYYRVGFEVRDFGSGRFWNKKMMAHAMAAYTTGDDKRGSLFDPNLGQYDIGQGHYKDWPSLWKDLWEYYDFKTVDACDVIPKRMVRHADADDFVHVDYDTLLTFSPSNQAAAPSSAPALPRSGSSGSFSDLG